MSARIIGSRILAFIGISFAWTCNCLPYLDANFGVAAYQAFLSCDQQEKGVPDWSTPAFTFSLLQNGLETHNYHIVVQSFSKQQKRKFLFKSLVAAAKLAGEKKNEFDQMCQQYELKIDELKATSKNAEEFLTAVIDRLAENQDSFIIELNNILALDSKPDIDRKPLAILMDGDRAVVRIRRYFLYSSQNSTTLEWVDHRAEFDANLFMRNYGNCWLVCPEEEWNDPTIVWTAPFEKNGERDPKWDAISKPVQ